MALSESLLTDELTDTVVIALGEALPPFNAFMIEAKEEPIALKESAVAGYLVEKSGTRPDVETPVSAATDATDFEPAASATNAAITVNTKLFWNNGQRSYAEALAGIPMKSLVPSMVNGLREELWDEITALITAANFATEVASIATASFGADDLKTMWALLPGTGETNGVFTKAAYANLLPTNLESFQTNVEVAAGFGLNGRFYPVENFTGADATTYGILTHPQAIVGAWGRPADPPEITSSVEIDEMMITDEVTGAQFTLSQWINTQSRTHFLMLTIMAGFAVGDATALCRIQTGA